MILKYRDYEYPGVFLQETGYLEPLIHLTGGELDDIKEIIEQNEYGIAVIPRYFEPYFHEANVLTKINDNEEGYFDFSKAIIDIGAHVGCYSFRSKFDHVYAFEPNKYVYHLLCVNLMIHNRFDISDVYNVMLSNKHEVINYDGFHTELKDQDNVIYNDLSLENYNSGRYLSKEYTHMLDEYDCNNVGFIKIDVEGMEEKILRGGIGTIIRNNYPPILFELWNVGHYGMTQEKHDSLQKFLESLGYEILWGWGEEETHLAIHKV